MAVFEVQHGGQTFEVEAPDQNAAMKALQGLKPDAPAAPPPAAPAVAPVTAPAAEAKPAPDKYQEAARADRDKLKANGVNSNAGLSRLMLQGMTLGGADEVLNGLMTPFEMIKRKTLDPREGYRYVKARENMDLEEGRKEAGVLAPIAEIGGGVASGAGLARMGVTAANLLRPAPGILARTGAATADAAGFGGVSGALEAEDGKRLEGAGKGVLIGGAVGAGSVPVAAAARAVAAPIASNIRARVNPEGVAQSQLARAVAENPNTPAQLAGDVRQAAAEGQGVYTLADALGNPGQRMLSTVTRAPGPGRTDAVEFLDARQAGQGRRVAQALAEGFDSPMTAAQTQASLTTARDTAADAAYGAARNNAGPVDVSRVLANIDSTLTPGVNRIATPGSQIANDSIETALEGFRNRLTDGRSTLTDFTALQRLRGDLSDAVNSAQRAGQGNRARMLGGVMRELDAAMETASTGFRDANRNFAQGSRNIEAVADGRTAATRGRPEDTIPRFQELPPEGQQGFRAGYVDPLVEQSQTAAFGVNKARPLSGDAFRDEAAVMAPGNDLMQRRIGREARMFETRNHATGNSRTADNLADQGAMTVDPSLIANLLSGNWMGAARGALTAGSNALTGYTPEVRAQLARLLMTRGGGADVQATIDGVMQQMERRAELARVLSRGTMGGASVSPDAIGYR